MDFGGVKDLVKALKEGFVYSWQYSPYQKKHHGSSSKDIPALSNLNRNSFDVSGMMGGAGVDHKTAQFCIV